MKLPRRLPWLLIPLLSFAWFWLFRADTWNGGDSEQWEREITNGVWLRKRQMLSFLFMQLSYQATHAFAGWTAHLAVNLTSCLAGAAAALLAWRLFAGSCHAGWKIALLVTSGFTTLFYGHVETYAMPAAVLLLHLLALQRVSRGQWPVWTIPATFLAGVGFHLVFIFLLPLVVLATVQESVVRKAPREQRLVILLLAAVFSFFLFAIQQGRLGDGELVGPHFVAPLRELVAAPWRVFTHELLPLKGRFLWWSAGLASLAALLALPRARARHRRFDQYLWGAVACFIGFLLIWNASAGEKDFDLFSFPGIVLCVIASRWVMALPLRSVLAGAILGTNLLLFATRPLHWADVAERGTGTLYAHAETRFAISFLLLDDRITLRAENRHVAEGARMIHWWVPGVVFQRRVINLQDGERYFILATDQGLEVSKMKDE